MEKVIKNKDSKIKDSKKENSKSSADIEKPKPVVPTSRDKNLNIHLGTYTGLIVNVSIPFKEITNNDDENKVKINKPIKPYSFKSSENMIKTIVHHKSLENQNFLFTSGTDEIIRIYNHDNNQEKGMIVSYSGTVNKLELFKKYIFAMCDNNIEIFKMVNFNKINTLSGHKHQIISFIVHSSGKLLFTIARDNYFMLWNLNSYKCRFRYNFTQVNELISINWAYHEKYIVLGFMNKILVIDYLTNSENFDEWKVFDHRITTSFDNPGKVLDIKVFKQKYIMIFKTNFDVEVVEIKGRTLKKVMFFNLKNLKDTTENMRIKFVEIIDQNNYDEIVEDDDENKEDIIDDKKKAFLITVNSVNKVHVYDLNNILLKLINKKEEEGTQNFESNKELDLLTDRFTSITLSFN